MKGKVQAVRVLAEAVGMIIEAIKKFQMPQDCLWRP